MDALDSPADLQALLDKYAFKLTPERRELLERAVSQRTRHFTLVLEDLKDPHNISAVIRTCEVFGLQDVHVIEELNSYRIAPAILKGSYKWMDIRKYRKRANCLRHLKERGYRVAVASTAATEFLDEIDLSLPTAFYLGSETLGNHPDTLASADIRFKIRQYGLTESMNVSVCAGMLIGHLTRHMAERGRERFTLQAEERRRLLADFYERSAVGVERNSPLRFMD